MSIEIVGWVAVGLTQVFWVPNLVRIFRTRDVEGYSLMAWIILLSGAICWFVYFAAQGDLVGIVANISGVAGSATTLVCILAWRDRAAVAPRSHVPERAELHSFVAEPLTTDQG